MKKKNPQINAQQQLYLQKISNIRYAWPKQWAQNIIIPLKHLLFSKYWPGLREMNWMWIRKIVLHIPINRYSI